jgi:uncharacterized protein YndB with AHSA1/START domain
MSYDWSQFSQKIKIKASAQKIYDMWATPAGLEYWFLRMAKFKRSDGSEVKFNEYLSKGDKYHWRWHGWPDEVEEFGEVLEANGKDKFRFVFGKAGIVTVDIVTENGHSIMHITQSDISTDEESKVQWHLGCSTGWTFYRCNLKSLLEGGIDIRNKSNTTDMND